MYLALHVKMSQETKKNKQKDHTTTTHGRELSIRENTRVGTKLLPGDQHVNDNIKLNATNTHLKRDVESIQTWEWFPPQGADRLSEATPAAGWDLPRGRHPSARHAASPPPHKRLTERAAASLDPKILQRLGERIEPLQPPKRLHDGRFRPRPGRNGRLPVPSPAPYRATPGSDWVA